MSGGRVYGSSAGTLPAHGQSGGVSPRPRAIVPIANGDRAASAAGGESRKRKTVDALSWNRVSTDLSERELRRDFGLLIGLRRLAPRRGRTPARWPAQRLRAGACAAAARRGTSASSRSTGTRKPTALRSGTWFTTATGHRGRPMGAYEDNFGFWEIDGPEERPSLQKIQRKSDLTLASVANAPSGWFRPKPFAPLASLRSNVARRPRANMAVRQASGPSLRDPFNSPEFGSVRGEAIAKNERMAHKGVLRSDLTCQPGPI